VEPGAGEPGRAARQVPRQSGTPPRSAIGTLVDRASWFTTLLYLPGRHTAEAVRDALIAKFSQLPPQP